jgi:hypothetical protein
LFLVSGSTRVSTSSVRVCDFLVLDSLLEE